MRQTILVMGYPQITWDLERNFFYWRITDSIPRFFWNVNDNMLPLVGDKFSSAKEKMQRVHVRDIQPENRLASHETALMAQATTTNNPRRKMLEGTCEKMYRAWQTYDTVLAI